MVAVLLGVAALVSVGAMTYVSIPQPPTVSRPQAATNRDVAGWLARVGVTPKQAAAAGLTPEQLARVFQDTQAYLSDQLPVLTQSERELARAKAAENRARELVQSGHAVQVDGPTRQAADQSLATAQALVTERLEAFRQAALVSLTAQQRDTLAHIQANSRWEVPVEYKTVSRPEAEWVRLRDALANQRVAVARGTVPDPELAQFLADANSAAAVAAAATQSGHQQLKDQWQHLTAN